MQEEFKNILSSPKFELGSQEQTTGAFANYPMLPFFGSATFLLHTLVDINSFQF
jgi:hypothetical protein